MEVARAEAARVEAGRAMEVKAVVARAEVVRELAAKKVVAKVGQGLAAAAVQTRRWSSRRSTFPHCRRRDHQSPRPRAQLL